MGSYQIVRRANGSYNHSMNVPLENREVIDWKRGEEIAMEHIEIEADVFILIVSKESDSLKVRRFLDDRLRCGG